MLALTAPDARARAVGAANTLWFDKGVLRSTNTDAEGFIDNLDASAPGGTAPNGHWCSAPAASSRAVIFGLLERGLKQIFITNRTPARARGTGGGALARRFVSWRGKRSAMSCREAHLLVNTTSLGMTGQPPLVVDVGRLPRNAVVADLVYAPLVTPLLAAALARGLRTADGLGMLLYQAVRGFSLWFGQPPQVTPDLRALSRGGSLHTQVKR